MANPLIPLNPNNGPPTVDLIALRPHVQVLDSLSPELQQAPRASRRKTDVIGER